MLVDVCAAPGPQAEDPLEEAGQGYNLMAVMESMGIYDTDLRATRANAHGSSVGETQRLLKILLATLNKAMSQGGAAEPASAGETSKQEVGARREPVPPDPDLRKAGDPPTNYAEVRAAGGWSSSESMGVYFSSFRSLR